MNLPPSAVAALCVAAAYLLGAIPFGLLIARCKGVDIRRVGSGNVGATNVFRSVGKGPGLLTFALDVAKGWLPAWGSGRLIAGLWDGVSVLSPDAVSVACGIVAVVGHNWPIYLRFQGGKGIATSAGALLGFAPLATGIGLCVWVVVFTVTRYVSVGSIVACLAVAFAGWWCYEGRLVPVTLTLLGAVGVWRHRTNVRRLLAGTEHRFGRKSDGKGEPADGGTGA